MMNKKSILILLILISFSIIKAEKPKLFIGAIAHIGNGKVIENSAISISNGVFNLIADASKIRIDPNAFDTIYRLDGKHIYPGFILPNTTLGITEIGAVRATHDYREVGNINPNVRSLIAYNTDSKISKTVRTNGVLIAQATPKGGIISGQSSIMYLNGRNWEDAQIKADDGVHLNWPSSLYSTGWWAEPGVIKKNKDYYKKIEEIERVFNKAYAYFVSKSIIDLKMESLKGLFDGGKKLYIHSNKVNDLQDAIAFVKKYKITNPVIVGGEEAIKIKSLLRENNIPVILNRTHRLPISQDKAIDEPFKQAMELKKADILFCLSYEGSMEAMGSRNLPFTAGTTIAYGQEYEDAIMSITLNAAKILGIDSIVGSIEKGKDATFFISTGDALDMRSNNVEEAFIKGKPIDLNNHQKELYDKYKKR
jgi:imidazolonepropionase-like amidohydrolase